jgi:hypothetical protein
MGCAVRAEPRLAAAASQVSQPCRSPRPGTATATATGRRVGADAAPGKVWRPRPHLPLTLQPSAAMSALASTAEAPYFAY